MVLKETKRALRNLSNKYGDLLASAKRDLRPCDNDGPGDNNYLGIEESDKLFIYSAISSLYEYVVDIHGAIHFDIENEFMTEGRALTALRELNELIKINLDKLTAIQKKYAGHHVDHWPIEACHLHHQEIYNLISETLNSKEVKLFIESKNSNNNAPKAEEQPTTILPKGSPNSKETLLLEASEENELTRTNKKKILPLELKDYNNEGYEEKIWSCFRLLKKYDCIESTTEPDDFRNIFSSELIIRPVIWKSPNAELGYFIKKLRKEQLLLSKHRLWGRAIGCFKRPDKESIEDSEPWNERALYQPNHTVEPTRCIKLDLAVTALKKA